MANDLAPSVNPFSSAPVAAQPSVAVARTDQQRAIAEVQAALAIARMNPRDPVAAMDRILNACSRPSLAEAAVYQYSRGGSDISGPSIRLAEAIAQQWGNMSFGIRELEQRGGESTVQAFAWDIETNTRREVTFQVPHVRHTKRGVTKLEDPRDVYELVANQGARRLRACILAVIPGDVTEAAVDQCELTMKAKADTSPDAVRKMLEAFSAFGVTREQIEARIQRRIDAITAAQLVGLKKVYASLRDGMSTAADWFEPSHQPEADQTEAGTRTDQLRSKLKRQTRQESPGAAPADPTASDSQPAQETSQADDTQAYEQLAADWLAAIEAVETAEALDDVAKRAGKALLKAPEQIKAQIVKALEVAAGLVK